MTRKAAVNGTVQHEILQGTAAVAYAAGDTLSILPSVCWRSLVAATSSHITLLVRAP